MQSWRPLETSEFMIEVKNTAVWLRYLQEPVPMLENLNVEIEARKNQSKFQKTAFLFAEIQIFIDFYVQK